MKLYTITHSTMRCNLTFKIVGDDLSQAIDKSSSLCEEEVGDSYKHPAKNGRYLRSIDIQDIHTTMGDN